MNSMKKILFVHEEFGRISEVFVHKMHMHLKRYFEVDLMAYSFINNKYYNFNENFKIYELKKESNFIFQIKATLNRKLGKYAIHLPTHYNLIEEINKSDAELVCFQFGFLPAKLGKDIRKIKKKIVIIHHGTDVNNALENSSYQERLVAVWKNIDGAIFVSDFLKNVAISVGCPASKAKVNYLGVEKFTDKINSFKDNNSVRFICVARMVPVKNHKVLISAFNKLVPKLNGYKNVELVLVGSGELENELKEYVSELGLENRILFYGALNHEKTIQEIANADVLVLASKVFIKKNKTRQEEGLPITLLEAASLGLPLIGSKTGGIPEVIEDGVNGLLVDSSQIDSLFQKMYLLAINDTLRKQMGKKAKECVNDKFYIENTMHDLSRKFLAIMDN